MAEARAPLWTSDEIARATGGTVQGGPFVALGVGIDSRELAPGDLFVALRAERDGHDFVSAALAAGAAGSLVSRDTPGSAVRVADTLQALGDLAAAARDRASRALRGAVTGSVGKTSVTQAVLAALVEVGGGHGSTRSFNNHIGVPLTLARMAPGVRAAIFEMGMNHAGEISPLSRLVRPHAVAITTVEAVHVENFSDGEAGVARAKAEIFEGVVPGGLAILNADNRWYGFLESGARERGLEVRAFGRDPRAAARLLDFAATAEGSLVGAIVDGEPVSYSLRHRAAHWGPMSLCALLMAQALGVPRATALAALGRIAPLPGRGAELGLALPAGRVVVIDDSYNASPVSVRAALRALAARETSGRRIAVLTDMLELGPLEGELHAGLAPDVEAAGVDLLLCAGPLMARLHQAIEPARRGGCWPTAQALAMELPAILAEGDMVLVKGSHASGADRIVAALAACAGER